MKKVSAFIFLLIGLIGYFNSTSCNRSQFSKQLASVDSLSQQTNNYLQQLQALDSASVMELAPLISADLSWVKDSLTSEDIKNSSLFLSQLKSGKKLMENFPKDYVILQKELKNSLKQLNDLKQDLKNNSISLQEANRYVSDESSALLIIEDQLNKVEGRINSLKEYRQIRDTFYLEAHARRKVSSK